MKKTSITFSLGLSLTLSLFCAFFQGEAEARMRVEEEAALLLQEDRIYRILQEERIYKISQNRNRVGERQSGKVNEVVARCCRARQRRG